MYDLFICHASEDKDAFVRPLAKSLVDVGLKVWYDEFSLKLGDSLRQSIDHGLANSRFGVVVLSPGFFNKNWPQNELNGLFSKETDAKKTILPVWHEVDRDYVLQRSPMLADRYAVKTSEGLDQVIQKILEVVEPEKAHIAKAGLTISVSPSSARLHTGEWAVRTPVIVSNRSESPLYNIQLRILIETEGVISSSVQIDPGAETTNLRGEAGGIIFSPDVIRLDMTGLDGKEFILLTIHTIGARQDREIIIWGSVQIESTASIQVLSFDTRPSELLEK